MIYLYSSLILLLGSMQNASSQQNDLEVAELSLAVMPVTSADFMSWTDAARR